MIARVFIIILISVLSINLYAQDKTLLDYDPCREEIPKQAQKLYQKAFSKYKAGKYKECSNMLQSIIKEYEDFASPYFLMGLIGVTVDNTDLIIKYFPLTKEKCEQFSHPYLYYYLGLIDYSFENYSKASENFETFLSLSEGINSYDSLQNEAINYISWSEFYKKTIENPVPFDPKNINFLAKNKDYYFPFITWDKSAIYFLRKETIRDTSSDWFSGNTSTKTQLLSQISLLDSNGFYDKGFVLPEPFNNSLNETGVSITADNHYLFYSKQSANSTENKSWDIFMCENIDGYWSEGQALSFNTKEFDEWYPSVSPCGNKLVFCSNRPGGKGKMDIWFVERLADNTWSEPINMGGNVNTFADETCGFLAGDSQHLYFLSKGRKTIGKTDLFCYDMSKNSPAVNLGYPINTQEAENSMGVMLNGSTAYTTRFDTNSKKYELITFVLPQNVRSKPRTIKKLIIDSDIDISGNLSVIDLNTNTKENYYFSSAYDNISLIVDNQDAYFICFDRQGYMFTEQLIDNTKDSAILQIKPLASGEEIELNNIVFNAQNGGFSEFSNFILDSFVNFLKLNRAQRIIIKANNNIGKHLMSYLIKSGIRDDRIEFQPSEDNKIIYQIK